MTDVVVTVPKWFWPEWIEEGQLPGEPDAGEDWHFYLGHSGGGWPSIRPGERVYVVAHNKLRGFAPLTRIESTPTGFALVRNGDAEAVTIDEPIRGFRGWRYRWWERDDEKAFPDWKQQ